MSFFLDSAYGVGLILKRGRFTSPYLVENETQFLPTRDRVDTAIWMHYLDANLTAGVKAWRQLHKNAASNIEQVPEATPHKAAAERAPTTHHENYQN